LTPAEIGQASFIARALTPRLRVVIHRPDIAVIGVGINVQVEPNVWVLKRQRYSVQENREQETLGDIWPCLMGIRCQRIVGGKALHVPSETRPVIFIKPIGEVGKSHSDRYPTLL